MQNPFDAIYNSTASQPTSVSSDSESPPNPFDKIFNDSDNSSPTQDVSSSNPFDAIYNPPEDTTSQGMIPNAVPVTQPFGNINNSVEVMSGGVNNGADFGTSVGTPLSLPHGQWQVVEAYGKDTNPGHIGDSTNSGYGNSVLVQNLKTGETLRMSHLSHVEVQPGQILSGGRIGQSGDTGNVTGPHVDIEYKNSQGHLQNVLDGPYGKYLPVLGR